MHPTTQKLGANPTQQFERDGFIAINQLFSKEEMESLKQEIRKTVPDKIKYGVYVGLSLISKKLHDFNGDPRLANILEKILSPHVEFLSDKLVFKNADVDYGSPWHQDWPYWEGTHKVSVWIALDDATPGNGCLKVIPGSHKSLARHDEKPLDVNLFVNRVKTESIDESKAVDLAVPAGSVVFFHDLMLHSSYKNKTGKDRWALISTYRDASVPDPKWLETNGEIGYKMAFMVCGTKRL